MLKDKNLRAVKIWLNGIVVADEFGDKAQIYYLRDQQNCEYHLYITSNCKEKKKFNFYFESLSHFSKNFPSLLNEKVVKLEPKWASICKICKKIKEQVNKDNRICDSCSQTSFLTEDTDRIETVNKNTLRMSSEELDSEDLPRLLIKPKTKLLSFEKENDQSSSNSSSPLDIPKKGSNESILESRSESLFNSGNDDHLFHNNNKISPNKKEINTTNDKDAKSLQNVLKVEGFARSLINFVDKNNFLKIKEGQIMDIVSKQQQIGKIGENSFYYDQDIVSYFSSPSLSEESENEVIWYYFDPPNSKWLPLNKLSKTLESCFLEFCINSSPSIIQDKSFSVDFFKMKFIVHSGNEDFETPSHVSSSNSSSSENSSLSYFLSRSMESVLTFEDLKSILKKILSLIVFFERKLSSPQNNLSYYVEEVEEWVKMAVNTHYFLNQYLNKIESDELSSFTLFDSSSLSKNKEYINFSHHFQNIIFYLEQLKPLNFNQLEVWLFTIHFDKCFDLIEEMQSEAHSTIYIKEWINLSNFQKMEKRKTENPTKNGDSPFVLIANNKNIVLKTQRYSAPANSPLYKIYKESASTVSSLNESSSPNVFEKSVNPFLNKSIPLKLLNTSKPITKSLESKNFFLEHFENSPKKNSPRRFSPPEKPKKFSNAISTPKSTTHSNSSSKHDFLINNSSDSLISPTNNSPTKMKDYSPPKNSFQLANKSISNISPPKSGLLLSSKGSYSPKNNLSPRETDSPPKTSFLLSFKNIGSSSPKNISSPRESGSPTKAALLLNTPSSPKNNLFPRDSNSPPKTSFLLSLKNVGSSSPKGVSSPRESNSPPKSVLLFSSKGSSSPKNNLSPRETDSPPKTSFLLSFKNIGNSSPKAVSSPRESDSPPKPHLHYLTENKSGPPNHDLLKTNKETILSPTKIDSNSPDYKDIISPRYSNIDIMSPRDKSIFSLRYSTTAIVSPRESKIIPSSQTIDSLHSPRKMQLSTRNMIENNQNHSNHSYHFDSIIKDAIYHKQTQLENTNKKRICDKKVIFKFPLINFLSSQVEKLFKSKFFFFLFFFPFCNLSFFFIEKIF